MRAFLIRWLVTAIGVFASTILPGISYDHPTDILLAALVLGILNALVRPALFLLSLPLLFLTLGLFTLVINAITFKLTEWLVPGFHIHGWFTLVFGALLVSLVSLVAGVFFRGSGARVEYHGVRTVVPEGGLKRVDGRVIEESER